MKRRGVWAMIAVTGALGAVVSCGSDDDKIKTQDEAGGQGGAAEPGAAGSPEQSPGGAAGAAGQPAVPEGGAGGQPSSLAGAPPVAGAGGESPAAQCLPSGAVQEFALDPEPTYSVCRAARLVIPFGAASSPEAFTCCARSEETPSFGLELSGLSTEEPGGNLSFIVPADAPLGAQYLTVTCDGSEGDNTLALEVTDTEPPVVTQVTPTLLTGASLVVTGTHLQAVTYIGAVAPDGTEYSCLIDEEGQSETSVSCDFDGIPIGDGYRLVVFQNDCGYALGSFTFNVEPGS